MQRLFIFLAILSFCTVARAADVIVNYQSGTGPQQVSAAYPLPVSASVAATTAATAASSLPTISPGTNSPVYESLGGSLYTQPVFGTASGGGTQVDATHGLPTNIITSVLPTGAATAANQTTGNASLAAIATNTDAATHAQCASLCSSLVVKNAAGTLFSFQVSADSTLAGAAWWVMIFDAASAPADGSVTPAKCYAVPSGGTGYTGAFDTGGVAFSTGIVIVASTNGCFTKAASAHAFIAGDFQ